MIIFVGVMAILDLKYFIKMCVCTTSPSF